MQLIFALFLTDFDFNFDFDFFFLFGGGGGGSNVLAFLEAMANMFRKKWARDVTHRCG